MSRSRRSSTATPTRHGPWPKAVLIAGVRLHFVERGSGPPVVMVHGNPGFVDEFLPLADRLADAFRVVAVDRPGHGHSERPSLPGTGPVESERLHAAVEGANLGVLPDAGHEVHRTRLDEVRAAVARVRR